MSTAARSKLSKRSFRYLGGIFTTILVLSLLLSALLAYYTLTPAYSPPALPSGEFRLDENHAASVLLALLQEETTNPPVRSETFALARERVINLLEREYVQPLGLEARRKDPIYTAALRASGSTRDAVILLSYVDLAPVNPEGWRCDPRGERHADEICGAGARQGKVKTVIDFEAVAALERVGRALPFHVVLVVLFDAQDGGEKSMKELLSSSGILADMKIRAVLDSSEFISETFPKRILPIAVAEKRGLWLRIFGDGSQGDAALPRPDHASYRLVSGLSKLSQWDKGGQRLLPVVKEFCRRLGDSLSFPTSIVYKNPTLLNPLLLYELSDKSTTQALIEASLGIQAFSAASEKSQQVPQLAEARLEIRLLPDQDPNAFLGEVRRRLSNDRINMEVIRMDPPAVETSFEAPWFRAIEGAAARVFPQKIVAPTILPGNTLASPFAYAGIPVLRLPPPSSTQEGPEESIRLTELRDTVEFTYQILFGASLTEGDPFIDLVSRRY